MQQNNSWLLPEGIEEILPQQAMRLEILRKRILELFTNWGYELVIPPMIDYIDSLLTGSGHDLDLQTFKLTDQLSGRTLGLRADMTPQVARLDAHHFHQDGPNRLCYVGTVLHTRGDHLEKSRSPMQIGAELYGHAGIESDVEIIRLMLEMLALAGLQDVHIDLGHVGIVRALSEQAELDQTTQDTLFDILQRKARPELQELIAELNIKQELKAMLLELPVLNGNLEILENAKEIFSNADQTVKFALDDLQAIATKISARHPMLPVSFDMAELRGYHYHTGVIYSAFVPTIGREIARGGRYDNIGSVFGRARPATGFSSDLKLLAQLNKSADKQPPNQKIFAPDSSDSALADTIRDLRTQNQIIIQQLPGQCSTAKELGCTAILVKEKETWVARKLD